MEDKKHTHSPKNKEHKSENKHEHSKDMNEKCSCESNCQSDDGAKCDCEGSCNCEGQCGCGQGDCGCCDDEASPKGMFCMFSQLADEAWAKLVKEKMKAVWEKKVGKDMEETAEFFVKVSTMRWMDSEGYEAKKEELLAEFTKMMEKKMNKGEHKK